MKHLAAALFGIALSGCAHVEYAPPPEFAGQAEIDVAGKTCCGLHGIPLIPVRIYAPNPESVTCALPREGYWLVCKAYPNHVKYPYSISPLPVDMLVADGVYCPKCESELSTAMRAAESQLYHKAGKKRPNRSPEPTPGSVTPPAGAGVAP